MDNFCINCGKPLKLGSNFCGNCGKACNDNSTSNITTQDKITTRVSHESPHQTNNGGWHFFAGTLLGGFLSNLFGNSSFAQTNTFVNHNETIINKCDVDTEDENFEIDDVYLQYDTDDDSENKNDYDDIYEIDEYDIFPDAFDDDDDDDDN